MATGSLTQRRTTATTSSSSNGDVGISLVSSSNFPRNDETNTKTFVKNSSAMTEVTDHCNGEELSIKANNKVTNNVIDVKLNYSINGQGKSMSDRKQLPNSFYVIFGTIIGIQYFSRTYSMQTITRYTDSMTSSYEYLQWIVHYSLFDVFLGQRNNDIIIETYEYMKVTTIMLLCISLFYIFFVAPYRAGFWTGPRTRKHKVHRYMGLFYLVHYIAAWLEFFSPTYNPYRGSYLCHLIAVNGIIQGMSAFISFKVLPELNDPGYYSDKAVLSRTFIHENLFFTTMAVFGSSYFISDVRDALRTNWGGRIIEHIYIFWPYICIRPWFPLTSFSNAGTTYKGRSDSNKRFYEIGTLMVKYFYLWAKYFFGFFINYSVYLNLIHDTNDWKLLQGMLLLNVGTVSLSVFLHTLRFKKVLPAKFTFTVYIIQIYLSFLAIPVAIKMFLSHPKLCALCIVGLLLNMTRSRLIHGLWCFGSMLLMTQTQIEW